MGECDHAYKQMIKLFAERRSKEAEQPEQGQGGKYGFEKSEVETGRLCQVLSAWHLGPFRRL